jgi:hypothetical protein
MESERILKNFEDMVEKGEVKVKPKKGGTTARKSSHMVTKRSSTKKGNGLSEESSEEDKSGSEQVSRGSVATVHQKLLALVLGKKAEDTVKEGKGKAISNRCPTKKARACDEDTPARH